MERLIVITGPTASGKTDLATQLAGELGGSIISADSRQVYVGMNIGTATPLRSSSFAGQEPHGHLEPDLIHGVEHYLFNIRRPDQPMSLSEWQAAAFSTINHAHAQSHTPLLVGGTMLYVDSIVKNYDLPNVPADVQFRQEKEGLSAETLYAELLKKDPATRDFIEPENKRRIIRALEVMAATGKTFSELRRQRPSPYEITIIGLFDGWEALEQRISQRVTTMLAEGLLEETQRLLDEYGADLPFCRR